MSDKPFTQADYAEFLERQKRAEASEKRSQILHGMEIRLAELIGANGDGGSFGALERIVESHAVVDDERHEKLDERVKKVEEFMNKAKWTIGLFAAGGGIAAVLVEVALKHWL